MRHASQAALCILICGAVFMTASAADLWPPAKLAEKLRAEPKTDLDKEIKALITAYEARIAGLDLKKPLVARNLHKLHDNLAALYMEYNEDKNRYKRWKAHFSPGECLDWWKRDMKSTVDDCIEKDVDPEVHGKGRWHAKACWVESTRLLVRYDVVVPREYDPEKSWPAIISYQSGPTTEQRRTVPYFFVSSVQKGYPKSAVHLEAKTRAIWKDVVRDFNIDPFRLYATGFSYGGHTCLRHAWRFPDWYAAIVPVCSDLRGKDAPNVRYIRNTPALLLHGTGDSFRSTGEKVHQFMKDAGADVKWETYPGGHNSDVPFQKNVRMITDFCDRYKGDPYPRRVVHVVEHKRYSRAFWVDCKLIKDMSATAVYEVEVKDGNVIEVKATEDIASLDLDLTDKLVDMKKPVKVVSEGKTLYEGPAGETVTVKLREGEKYWARKSEPLWKELVVIQKERK